MPFAPFRPKSYNVLALGVAVKAKKLTFAGGVRAAIERDYRGPGGEMPWVWQSLSAAGAGALALP